MLEYGSNLTPNAARLRSAQLRLCLCLSLCLQRLSSRVASNVSDKRPSANPPREISALTSPMLCRAQFCSAEPASSVALLPKRSLRLQGVKRHHPVQGASRSPGTPHSYMCHGHYTPQVGEAVSRVGIAVLLYTVCASLSACVCVRVCTTYLRQRSCSLAVVHCQRNCDRGMVC